MADEFCAEYNNVAILLYNDGEVTTLGSIQLPAALRLKRREIPIGFPPLLSPDRILVQEAIFINAVGINPFQND